MFPPTLIVTGTRSFELSNAVYTHAQLVNTASMPTLHVWEGMFHGFFYNPDVPESRECYDVIVRFFAKRLGKQMSAGARMYRRFSALALLLCCGFARRRRRTAATHWVSTWGTAQQLAAETLPVWVVPPPREPNEPPPRSLLPPYPTSFQTRPFG